MHLVELLVPVKRGASEQLDRIRSELTERFGGVTAFTRAPAEGLWKETPRGEVEHDDVIVIEVMVETLDRTWWAGYREELARRLDEHELVVRAHPIERL